MHKLNNLCLNYAYHPRIAIYIFREKNPLEVSKLKERQLYEILTMVQYGSDLMNAMNILPGSWLNPLNVSFTTKYKGIFGMIASAVGIYKMFRF